MKWLLAVALCLGAGAAWGQDEQPSPLVGKWCSQISNGMRIMTIEKVERHKVTGRYVWTGPGQLDEEIGGTFYGGKFTGGGTVQLNLTLVDGRLQGTARRQEDLGAVFERCW